MKYGNWAILLFFSLVIGTALWWFTPRRVVNECDELRKDLEVLKGDLNQAEQKIYKFEHPEEHTEHFGKLGVRRLAAFRISDNLYQSFSGGYRYPLELKCGCSDCKCIEPPSLLVGEEYRQDLSNHIVEVRVLKKDEPNYYELLRTRPDLDSLQVSTTAQQ